MGRLIDTLRAGDWQSVAGCDGVAEGVAMALNAATREEGRRIAAAVRERIDRRRRKMQPFVDSAVPVVADDVAAFAYSQEEPVTFRDWDWSKDFPVLSPTFPNFFVEWVRPLDVIEGSPLLGQFRDVVFRKAGVLFAGGPRSEAVRCPLPTLTSQAVDYHSYLTLSVICEFSDDNIADLGSTGGVLVDSHGRVVGDPVIRNECKDDPAGQWMPLFRSVAAIGLLALTFMHCKQGVRIVEVEPPERLNRARVKRGKKPLVRYRTVVIDGLKDILRREGGIESVGLKRALHLVRGHFVTYTPEHPLFGHFVGTVFRSAHIRGKKSAGVVKKDYRVEAHGDRRGTGDA